MRVILAIIPFALLLVLIYYLLLSDFDINYYLSGRPPEWRLAVGLGGLVAAVASFNLMRQFVSWVFCLPLLLFSDLRRRIQAMSKSQRSRPRPAPGARMAGYSAGCRSACC